MSVKKIPESTALFSRDYFAEILPSRGANCVRLCHIPSGSEILRTPESMADFTVQNPFLYGMPPLFPPNRIETGGFTFEGREYTFPVNEPSTNCHLHGTLHQTPFRTEYTDECRARFSYSATADAPYHGFPHSFTLSVEYLLTNFGLEQTVAVKNGSDTTMPFALAFHTTFRLPFCSGSRPEDISVHVPNDGEYERDGRFLPTGRLITNNTACSSLNNGEFLPYRNNSSALLKRHENADIRIVDHHAGLQAVYEADEKYRFWMVFNGGSKDFICLEPQTCISNAPYTYIPDSEKGCLFVSPGESLIIKNKLRIISL